MEDLSKSSKLESRVSAMISDLLLSRAQRGGRVYESSFKRIPSVKSFEVKVGQQNEFLLDTGLDRRMKADFKLILNQKQNRANEYMESRLRAMKSALSAGKVDIFWAMAIKEMKHSVCFRTSSFNAVFPGWYKNMDFQRAVQINFGVEHILKKELDKIKYFRVEIPKGNAEEIALWFKNNPGKAWPGKMRPLGVPTAPWRVVLHMWNGFLTMFLEEELKQFNHAYMPNRGTLTAWGEFIQKARHAKYIYEFDIKGFFNNVHIGKTVSDLIKRGMPESISATLKRLLFSYPSNLEPVSMRDQKFGNTYYKMGPGGLLKKVEHKSDYDASLALRHEFEDEERLKKLPPFMRKMKAAMAEKAAIMKGLPQGAAPSTILSILALADWFGELKSRGVNLLMYADDGLLYSDKPFVPHPPKGFEFAEEKCSWVKRENETHEVKFLGIVYNFDTKLIRGATRSGSTLEFGADQLNVLESLRNVLPGSYTDLMEALVKTNVFGLALSKLYGGKFGKLEYKEDIKYHKQSYWARYHNLSELQNSKALEKTASTVACGWLLCLNNYIMNHQDRDKFFEEAKSYHKLRDWEIHIDEIKAAFMEDETWNKNNDGDTRAPWEKDPNWRSHYGAAD